VDSIPRTVIINKDGKIAADLHPNGLNEKLLNDVLDGKVIKREERARAMPPGGDPLANASHAQPILQIVIRPSRATEDESTWAASGDSMTMIRHSPQEIILAAFDARKTRSVIEAKLPDGYFDLISKLPRREERAQELLRSAVGLAFHVRARTEEREFDAFVLTKRSGVEPELVPTVSTGGSGSRGERGQVQWINCPVSNVAYSLESALGRPVLDETGISGRFDMRLQWNPDEPESIVAAVKKRFRLDVKPVRRKVEFVIITAAK
jgi:uncharacterized protein (TIGR03435 family)